VSEAEAPRIRRYIFHRRRLKTFYSSYIKFGGGKNQFRQIVTFAKKRVYSRTAMFVALLNQTTTSEYKALTKLIIRDAVKKGVVPIMINAQ
jgi:hypothetical protein